MSMLQLCLTQAAAWYKRLKEKENLILPKNPGILPGHIPTVAPLKIAAVRLKKDGQTELVAVSGGIVEVRPDHVTILAQTAETSEQIDKERALAAKRRAEERLQKQTPDVDIIRAEFALKRAITRLDVAR